MATKLGIVLHVLASTTRPLDNLHHFMRNILFLFNFIWLAARCLEFLWVALSTSSRTFVWLVYDLANKMKL